MPRHYSTSEMNRRGLANPIKRCPKCGKIGPVVSNTKVCVECGALAHNEIKKLTLILKQSNG